MLNALSGTLPLATQMRGVKLYRPHFEQLNAEKTFWRQKLPLVDDGDQQWTDLWYLNDLTCFKNSQIKHSVENTLYDLIMFSASIRIFTYSCEFF